MNDILDLPGWSVLAKRLDGTEYELESAYDIEPTACQKCGVIGRLYKHGTKDTTYRDSPIRGHSVRLLVKVKRYKCRDCGGTFLQPLGGIQEDMRMTSRCAAYIKEQCLRDTFVRIADNIGCDDKTVRNLAGDHIESMNQSYRPVLPYWLGIDETQIDGKMRLVLTDLGARQPVDMLANRDKGTLAGWLHHFKDRSHVKGVSIDMWRPYRDISNQMMPGVPVVVDKFHVVRTASYCMERVRIRLQKVKKAGVRADWLRSKALLNMRYAKLNTKQRFNVDMWLDNEPELAGAHRLKEAFYGIYDMPKAEAIAAFDGYAASIPPGLKADFKTLTTSMKNWRTEILAYFDHPISNAYTEALNGVAKTINRQGRGYSFEVLRARLLFSKPAAPARQYKTIFPANQVITALLLEENGNRCDSCQGIFQPGVLEATHIAAVVAGEHRIQGLLCADCHRRIHTDWKGRHGSVTTR